MNNSLRFRILQRDDFRCRYCGHGARPDVPLEVDHIEPKSKGGADSWLNLVAACYDCNRGKRDTILSPESVERIRAQIPPEPTVAKQVKKAIKKVVRKIREIARPVAKPRVLYYCGDCGEQSAEGEVCRCEERAARRRQERIDQRCRCQCDCREQSESSEDYCSVCVEDHCRECGDEISYGYLTDAGIEQLQDEGWHQCVDCFERESDVVLEREEDVVVGD